MDSVASTSPERQDLGLIFRVYILLSLFKHQRDRILKHLLATVRVRVRVRFRVIIRVKVRVRVRRILNVFRSWNPVLVGCD